MEEVSGFDDVREELMMAKFKPARILHPTDFSETSTIALRWAQSLAERFGAELTIIYADRFGPAEYLEISPEYLEDLPHEREKAVERLRTYIKSQLPGSTTWREKIVIDFPVPGILHTAQETDPDLIVMGTHGRTGIRRALLGSIAEGVLHGSDRPVMTVRHKEGEPLPGSFEPRKILCPVNFTEIAHAALDHASAVACAFDAELVVLHVVESLGEVVQQGEFLDRLKEWISPDVQGRCDYKELVVEGHAAAEIIDFSARIGIDLITIGAQHQAFHDTTVIGTTTEKITRHSFCPVLTVTRRIVPAKSGSETHARFMEPIGLIV